MANPQGLAMRRLAVAAASGAIALLVAWAWSRLPAASLRVLETSHPPTYYLPADAFAPGVLRPTSGHTSENVVVRR